MVGSAGVCIACWGCLVVLYVARVTPPTIAKGGNQQECNNKREWARTSKIKSKAETEF